VCAHAFIGKLNDGSMAAYQTLPWNHRGWHCFGGPDGSGNDTHISIEICEDGLGDAAYFSAAYKEAAELCAYLCNMYGLDPAGEGVLIGHYEGYQRGIATNHADPGHWFPKHGKSMEAFRADVKALLAAMKTQVILYCVQVGAYAVRANAEAMLANVKAQGFTEALIKIN
jgi:N-acetylmuramoyl-L-alanine amidase